MEKNGLPKIVLKNLNANVVVYTSLQKEYDVLMQICEAGGRTFAGRYSPTEKNIWRNDEYKARTCIIDCEGEGYLYPSTIDYEAKRNRVLNLDGYIRMHEISPETINKIKNWFEENKPDRESKG